MRRLTLVTAVCVTLVSLGIPYAQSATVAAGVSYPTKAIRLVVPFAPGGSNDIMARLSGQKFSESLGEQVVVDNRGGASGIIGTDTAAKAPPDGYTLLMMSLTLAVNPSLMSDADIEHKVRDLAAGTPSDHTRDLIELAWSLDRLDNASTLARATVPEALRAR